MSVWWKAHRHPAQGGAVKTPGHGAERQVSLPVGGAVPPTTASTGAAWEAHLEPNSRETARAPRPSGPLHRNWSIPSTCLATMKPASWRKGQWLRQHTVWGLLLHARDTVQLGRADNLDKAQEGLPLQATFGAAPSPFRNQACASSDLRPLAPCPWAAVEAHTGDLPYFTPRPQFPTFSPAHTP